jgi:lipoate-protein ligase A
VIEAVRDLYDYATLRSSGEATVFVPDLTQNVVVLGARQSSDLLEPGQSRPFALRRRRGGGGLVLLQSGDVWVDWWIPAADERWSNDVHVTSIRCGEIWRDVLASLVEGEVTVHEGPLEGEFAHRVVCFAGKGPGEVFVDGRKAVGLTQWRVREGVFLSTVLHAHDSRDVLTLLREAPDGLGEALDHQTLSTLGIRDGDGLVDAIARRSSPARLLRPNLFA